MRILMVDLFCGAGGTSEGASQVDGVEVIACVNHDANAIRSHAENHPDCVHFTEDIRTLDLTELVAIVMRKKAQYPGSKVIVWASLECTNFSKAKGGLPRNADSRTLADHLDRYQIAINPDCICIENVEEFMCWGPLDENGKPISRKNGLDYHRWINHMKGLGNYEYEYQILNSANYGAYTSRKRFFAQFTNTDMLPAWPVQTHIKRGAKPVTGDLFSTGILKPWKPVRDVLMLDIHGESIFGRKKDLSPKTYERIYLGCIKFYAGGKEAFLLNYQHSSSSNNINEPCPTLTCKDKYGFVTTYHGNGANVHSVHAPAPTVPTKDSQSLITPTFIMRDFSGGGQTSDIESPAGSVMPSPKMNLVSAEPYLMDTQFNNVGADIGQPAPTQTANRKHFYLMNPQYMNAGSDIDNPAFTLIARMDKAPPYLVKVEEGRLAIKVEPTDNEWMVKIKEFMAMYGIVDIKMRMLFIDELKAIQGLPKDYVIYGTQAQQKKCIGNMVEVTQAKVILEAIYKANFPMAQQKVA